MEATGPIKVLIVEDNESDAILAQRALRRGGLAITVAVVDSADGLNRVLLREGWDIVLCDYSVPGIDVDFVLQSVGKVLPFVSVVLLTGSVGDEAVAELMRRGLADVVLKHRVGTRLPSIVRREVTRSRERAADAAATQRRNALIAAFNAAADWHGAIELSLQYLTRDLRAMLGVMWEASGPEATLQPIASWAEGDDARREVILECWRQPARLTLVGRAILEGESLAVSRIADFARDPDKAANVATLDKCGVTSLTCEPMEVDGRRFGLSMLFSGQQFHLSEATADLHAVSTFLQPVLRRKVIEYEGSLLRHALDAIDTGVIITDADLDPPGPRILYANRAVGAITGHDPGSLAGLTPRILHGDGTDATVLENLYRDMRAGRPGSAELIHYRSDNTQFLVELKITPVREQDVISNYIGIQNDITSRRQAERDRIERETAFRAAEQQAAAALRDAKSRAEQAEMLLRDAMDSVSEGIIIFDHEDRFVMCNEAYHRIFAGGRAMLQPGIPFEAYINRIFAKEAELVDTATLGGDFITERIRRYRERSGSMEYRLNSGTWIRVTDRPMKNGGTAGLRIDITALKNAERALRESEERFRHVVESISEIFWIGDLATGGMIFVNSAYEKATGHSRDELYGSAQAWRELVHGMDRERFVQARQSLQSAGSYELEYRIVRADGTIRWLHESAYAVNNGNGHATLAAGVAEDVTARRELEAQLQQSQKMEALGALTGGIAHDFNNLLGVIMVNLDLLKRTVAGNNLAGELCDEALAGAASGAELIKRLLAFARRQPLHPKSIDVSALIGDMAVLLGRTLGANVTLHTQLDRDLRPVLADPVQLQTALLNFVSNARDAMPKGGRLTIGARSVALGEEYTRIHPDVSPGDYVLIEIADTGLGIPPDALSHIFDPFFTTKEAGEGTGLGLAMIYGFAKQSGGHLTAYSELGLGTTFRLYLPQAGGGAATPAARQSTQKVVGGDETVLVVEDNAPLRQATAAQLTELGYHVLTADHVAAALATLGQGGKIDVVFSDVAMPGTMDGIDLALEVKRTRPRTRMLLTSGFAAARHDSDRLAGLAVPIIDKPYRRDELARALRAVLDDTG